MEGAPIADLCLFDMLICVRTTLNLDDDLMRAVKRRAAESGETMTEIIERALRGQFSRASESAEPFVLELPTVRGRLRSGVDLTDRDTLYELMETGR